MSTRTACYADRRELFATLTAQVSDDIASALERKPRVTLVVPGGSTPLDFLHNLSLADLDWGRVYVTLSDERWVKPDSERSNLGMLRRTLLVNRAAAARVVSLYREADSPEAVLEEIETDLRALLPVDVCVLGMGTDGHIASLFPGADGLEEALAEASTHVVLPMRVPGSDEVRISLSAQVLRDALVRHLLITGEEKKRVLDAAREAGHCAQAPVRVILHGVATQVHYAP
jgi:6-phosphogluconolactonase